MITFFINNLLWTEGIFVAGILAVLAVFFTLFYKPALYLCVALFIFSIFFFRNPDRVCAEALHDNSVIISPADGKILSIEQESMTLEGHEYAYKISIFLSPFDVHVNWMPCAGLVTAISYHKGSFYPAFLPKTSELNERNTVTVQTASGAYVRIIQITGTIARTIVCWVSEGKHVEGGVKFGMMKYGSRIDLFLPSGVQLEVAEGQKVCGGETVIGRFM